MILLYSYLIKVINNSFLQRKDKSEIGFYILVRRVGNTEVKSGFIPSLFNNVPPTIRFCTENQRRMKTYIVVFERNSFDFLIKSSSRTITNTIT